VTRVSADEPVPLQGLLAERLAWLAGRKKGVRTPALSYAVATPGGPPCLGAVGVADVGQHRAAVPDDQYPWFSMTKIATLPLRSGSSAEASWNSTHRSAGTWPTTILGGTGTPQLATLLTHTAGLSNPVPIRWIRPVGQPPDDSLVASILRKHGRPHRAPGASAQGEGDVVLERAVRRAA
jgi:CubicO group peptidase (beta-lactamase class C family)